MNTIASQDSTAPLKSTRRVKEDHNKNNLNGSLRNKQESRRQQREQARDQNRPNLASEFSSPEYEVLNTSFEADESSDSEDEKPANVRRTLNESFEQIKQREKWQQEQKQARRMYFAKNRRTLSENSNHQQRKRSGSSGQESFTSAEDFSRYLSCISLNSDTPSDIHSQPRKEITRNFFMSHHAEVNRQSDIFVRSASSLCLKNDETILTWLDVKSFILGFFFAFATVFKSFFTTKV